MGKKYKDIEIGDVFDRWTVIKKGRLENLIDKNGKSRPKQYWWCKCSCEKHTFREVNGETLKNGTSTSCGCIRKEKAKESSITQRKYNLNIGEKYDNWTIIDHASPIGRYANTYLCECDCEYHTQKVFRADSLVKEKHYGCIKCFNANDLSGQTFGRLTVIKKNEYWSGKYGCTTYDCKCSCGNPEIKHIRQSSLITNSIRSCGCIAKEVENLVGQTFGELTVTRFVGKKYYKKSNFGVNVWECICSCGNIHMANQNALKCGHCTSCGCQVRSNGERYIKQLLTQWGYKYIEQYRFKDCKYKNTLPFDFAILDCNDNIITLIEFDGRFHYDAIRRFNMTQEQADNNLALTQLRDNIKNEYCNKNNIPLIRIPYWILDNGDIDNYLFDCFVKLHIIEEIKSA